MTSELFACAAERLEQRSGLARLEARGTLRLALKSAGLDAESVTVPQLRVVFERVLPAELETRGVSEAAAVCAAVIAEVERTPLAQAARSTSSTEDIFRRLGGD